MVKKTVIAIICIVLLAVISVSAYKKIGMTDYGAVYQYNYPFGHASYYYPYYQYPVVEYPYYGDDVYLDTPKYYTTSYYAPVGFEYPANPLGNYRYSYLNPISSHYMYRYGYPQLSYPAPVSLSRGYIGEPCGVYDGWTNGCAYGLVCDYTKVKASNLGLCSTQSSY